MGTNPKTVHKLCVAVTALMALHPVMSLVFVCIPDHRDMDPVSLDPRTAQHNNALCYTHRTTQHYFTRTAQHIDASHSCLQHGL